MHIPRLIAFSLLFSLTVAAAPAKAPLVAPQYPGSKSVPSPQSRVSVTFGTNDSFEKIRAFYVPKHARLATQEGVRLGANFDYLEVFSYRQVQDIILKSKGDITLIASTGIEMERKTRPAGPFCFKKFFQHLKNEVLRNPARSKDFDAACQKYGHIEYAFSIGKKVEELFKRCEKEAFSPAQNQQDEMKKVMAQMQKLAEQGRYAEMAELQKKAAPGLRASSRAASQDKWDFWIKCLAEADSYAYLTEIRIATHPSTW